MNQHLSWQQIAECLTGAGGPLQERHACECAACRAEIETLSMPLALFRLCMHDWSERQRRAVLESRPLAPLAEKSFDRAWYSAGAGSVLIHCAALAALLVLGTVKPAQRLVRDTATMIAPGLKAYVWKSDTAHGGGGGGTRSLLEAKSGSLPKVAPRVFTPPRVDVVENPKLPMTPTILSDIEPPKIDLPNDGDPLAQFMLPSNGPGSLGGIGTGDGGGVGPGHGSGFGPGANGGFTGGAFRPGGGVSAPIALFRVEPEYSEEARKAKFQGMVLLQLVVDEKGMPQQIRVLRPLGLGLDQKAVEAVAKWRFKPGTKDGKAVPVVATIEVNFRLL